MNVTPGMIKEVEDEAMSQADQNPHGHPDDWLQEAAWTVARRRFPAAPDQEQHRVAEELWDRASLPPWMHGGSTDPEFDIG